MPIDGFRRPRAVFSSGHAAPMDGPLLVTGGCGFIGSHLIDRLIERGCRVRILDDLSTGRCANAHREAELVIGDVADQAAVRRAMNGISGCFHLAAVASVVRCNEDPIPANRVNLVGTLTVLGAAAEAKIPVVYASSAAVYGAQTAPMLSEGSETRPRSVYGADKLACELHAHVACALHGLSAVGLRLFNVYGARQDPTSPYSGVISIFVARLFGGLPITIFGDGRQLRDFVHVGDAADAFIAAMAANRPGHTVCNVCTGFGISINGLAEAIGRIIGVRLSVIQRPTRAGDLRRSIGDPQRARELLGVRALTPLEEGLRQLIHDVSRGGETLVER